MLWFLISRFVIQFIKLNVTEIRVLPLLNWNESYTYRVKLN